MRRKVERNRSHCMEMYSLGAPPNEGAQQFSFSLKLSVPHQISPGPQAPACPAKSFFQLSKYFYPC